MYKKKYSVKRKRTTKRSYKKKTFRAKRIGTKMMGKGSKMVAFKQSALIDLLVPLGTASPTATVCFLNNPVNATLVQTIKPNGVGAAYSQFNQMAALYDEFTCTGVRVKYFQIPNLGGNAYILSECIQDDNNYFSVPNPTTYPMNVYGNYQTIPLNQNNNWSRYFPTAALKKKLGIGWCSTADTGFTYYGQLDPTTVPSFTMRNQLTGPVTISTKYSAAEVTWYYKFKGLKSSLATFQIAQLPQQIEAVQEQLPGLVV